METAWQLEVRETLDGVGPYITDQCTIIEPHRPYAETHCCPLDPTPERSIQIQLPTGEIVTASRYGWSAATMDDGRTYRIRLVDDRGYPLVDWARMTR